MEGMVETTATNERMRIDGCHEPVVKQVCGVGGGCRRSWSADGYGFWNSGTEAHPRGEGPNERGRCTLSEDPTECDIGVLVERHG